jgi:hypothetical protein
MAERESGEFETSREAYTLLKQLKLSQGRGKKINQKLTARIEQVEKEAKRLHEKGK